MKSFFFSLSVFFFGFFFLCRKDWGRSLIKFSCWWKRPFWLFFSRIEIIWNFLIFFFLFSSRPRQLSRFYSKAIECFGTRIASMPMNLNEESFVNLQMQHEYKRRGKKAHKYFLSLCSNFDNFYTWRVFPTLTNFHSAIRNFQI